MKSSNNKINCEHHELRPKKQAFTHGATLLNRYELLYADRGLMDIQYI